VLTARDVPREDVRTEVQVQAASMRLFQECAGDQEEKGGHDGIEART